MTEERIKQLSNWSMVLSMLCAVHCALMPFLMILVSVSGSGLITSHFWEVVILGGSLVLAGFALLSSYRNHNKPLPLLLFSAAVILAIPGLIFHLHVLTFLVSIVSAVALGLNWMWTRRYAHTH